MFLKILDRYILRQYLANLALGLVVFTFVLLLDRLFELANLLINKGAGIILIARLIVLLLPASFSLTLPIANLLTSLLTFGHMSETHEITAARAAGIASWKFIKTPFQVAFLSVCFLVPFNTRWAPRAHAQFRQLYLQLLQRNPLVQIEERTFGMIGDYHLYVARKTWARPPLHGVTIYRISDNGAPLRIFADLGEAFVDSSKGVQLVLQDGHIEEINPQDLTHWYYTKFKAYTMYIPFENQKIMESRSIEEMDNAELAARARQLRLKGLPAPVYLCEMQMRWALAVTPLLFIFLGIPLAIRLQRGGRSIGFGLCLVILLAYYVLLMSGFGIGQRGALSPYGTVWFANLVLGVVGAVLSWRMLRL